jgi:hypothetical protein
MTSTREPLGTICPIVARPAICHRGEAIEAATPADPDAGSTSAVRVRKLTDEIGCLDCDTCVGCPDREGR